VETVEGLLAARVGERPLSITEAARPQVRTMPVHPMTITPSVRPPSRPGRVPPSVFRTPRAPRGRRLLSSPPSSDPVRLERVPPRPVLTSNVSRATPARVLPPPSSRLWPAAHAPPPPTLTLAAPRVIYDEAPEESPKPAAAARPVVEARWAYKKTSRRGSGARMLTFGGSLEGFKR
jgi:hypothetical protein